MSQQVETRTLAEHILPVAQLYLDDIQNIYHIVEKLGIGRPTIKLWVTIPKLRHTSEVSAFEATADSVGALRVYGNDGRDANEEQRIAQVIIRANTPKGSSDYAWIEVILLDQRAGTWEERPGSNRSRITIFPEQREGVRQAMYEIEAIVAAKAKPQAPRWLVLLAVLVYLLAVVIVIPIILEFLSISRNIPALYIGLLYWMGFRIFAGRLASSHQRTSAIIPMQRDQEQQSFWEVQPGKAIVWMILTILAAVLGWATTTAIGLLIR